MRNQGFTLLELMIIIVIIGILASIAVPRLFNVTGTAGDVSIQYMASEFKKAIDFQKGMALLKGSSTTHTILDTGGLTWYLNDDLFIHEFESAGTSTEFDSAACAALMNEMMSGNETNAEAGADCTEGIYCAVSANATCSYTYRLSATNCAGFTYTPLIGSVSLVAQDGQTCP